jgi:hypothetical protein
MGKTIIVIAALLFLTLLLVLAMAFKAELEKSKLEREVLIHWKNMGRETVERITGVKKIEENNLSHSDAINTTKSSNSDFNSSSNPNSNYSKSRAS